MARIHELLTAVSKSRVLSSRTAARAGVRVALFVLHCREVSEKKLGLNGLDSSIGGERVSKVHLDLTHRLINEYAP